MAYNKYQTAVKCWGSYTEVTNDNIEKALRKFKKKVVESGILQELREREAYIKPTTKRKKAKSVARRRWLKKLENEKLPVKDF